MARLFDFLNSWFVSEESAHGAFVSDAFSSGGNIIADKFLEYYSTSAEQVVGETPPDEILAIQIIALSLAESPGDGSFSLLLPFSDFLKNFCKDSSNYNAISHEGKEFLDAIFSSQEKPIQHGIAIAGCK